MKLLLDQNLSQRLLRRLERVYGGSKHVKDVGLAGGEDERICGFRLRNAQFLCGLSAIPSSTLTAVDGS